MDEIRISEELRRFHGKLLSVARRNHCVRVGRLASYLACRFGADSEKAYIAGYLHDIARELGDKSLITIMHENGKTIEIWEKRRPVLLHGKAGALLVGRNGVTDRETMEAIEDHVTGRPEMGLISCVVFAADYLEPGRYFLSRSEQQEILNQDLSHMLMAALEATTSYIDPDEIAKPALDLYTYLKEYVS